MIEITHQCPQCGGYIVRIRRRFIDRLISVVRPVQRYKCQHYNCHWQGNIFVGFSGQRILTRKSAAKH